MTYKCHNSLAPVYLLSLFHRPSHQHNTRSRNLTTLPSTRTTYGQHAFAFIGASLWRSLPASIRDSYTFSAFSNAATHFDPPGWILLYILF
jgi:hypothetical protein